MRRLLTPMTMGLALVMAGGMSVAAQDTRTRIRIQTPHEPHYGADQSSQFKVEQTDKQVKTLAIGASGELTLKNIVGDITVKTGGGKDVSVEIIRISRGKTDADAKTGLERVVAEVTVRGERGSVETRYPDDKQPPYAVSVAYNVTAPAGTQVDIDTITGNVRVTGVQGEVNAKAVTGLIELTTCARVSSVRTITGTLTLTDVRNDTAMDVSGVSAEIRLTRIKVPKLTSVVVTGSITAHEIQADGVSLGSTSGNIEFSGSVTAKGHYDFHAQSGDVKLALTGGFELDGQTFSGRVETDPALKMTGTVNAGMASRLRAYRGTAGDGGATVTARTFSGNVWVGRKLN